jgi:hypothetical protein
VLTVRLLKTSPANAQLMALYQAQQLSSATWGQNVFSLTNAQTGDSVACSGVAFQQRTKLGYKTKAGMNEWKFECISMIETLGTYNP